ncbi:hypothetical protein ABTL07_19485, partial [Acinetobacter baumannii]
MGFTSGLDAVLKMVAPGRLDVANTVGARGNPWPGSLHIPVPLRLCWPQATPMGGGTARPIGAVQKMGGRNAHSIS